MEHIMARVDKSDSYIQKIDKYISTDYIPGSYEITKISPFHWYNVRQI